MTHSRRDQQDRTRLWGLILGAVGLLGLASPGAEAGPSTPAPLAKSGTTAPQISGLWFDPATQGQGFNLQITAGGLFGFYYGYGEDEPLWLVFDVLPGDVVLGESMQLDALVPQEGVFGAPVPPEQGGVAPWGTLTLRFDSCTQAQARLEGLTGIQEFDLMLLVGIDGFDPTDCSTPDAAGPLVDATGAWFDPTTSGQGWNFVQTGVGLIAFFYGYDQSGAPLWLITEEILDIELGAPQSFNLLAGQGGSFDSPVPPQQLERWGTVELTLASCRSGVAVIAGEDGQQEQQLQMLVGVPGLPECVQPVTLNVLNDTGIQFCGSAGFGNSNPCIPAQPQGQDAQHGRDALAAAGQLSKVGAGSAGFDFTKISNSGHALSAEAQLGPGPDDWACTRDNVTGLIWEVKVDDAAHRRHALHGYTWFDPNSVDGHQGAAGNTASCINTLGGQSCNTHQYRQAVNAEGLCAANDWRMPTRLEMESVMDYSRTGPTIDTDYFPNTPSESGASIYWTGLPRADSAAMAWAGFFDTGGIDYRDRSSPGKVRLVRAGH